MEQWKPIKGYEGLYEVSDAGHVRCLPHVVIRSDGTHYPVRQKILKPILASTGYLFTTLYKSKKPKIHLVHRLVAEAFCTKIEGCDFVDHIDCERTNNNSKNLRWVTSCENNNNPISKERRIAKLREFSHVPVFRKDRFTGDVTEYGSLKEAAEANHLDRSTIRRYAIGKVHCKLYEWTFVKSKRKQRINTFSA